MKGTRGAAGLIALIAWVGLAVQFAASLKANGTIAETAWVMLRFFTILTNLAVAAVMTGIAFGKGAFRSPGLLGGITLAILLVGIVYNLLLRGLLEPSGHDELANLLLHQVTPVLVPLFWLFSAPKGGLGKYDPWRWAFFPLAYFGYALFRGAFGDTYPYPFMDVAKIGWGRTLVNGLLIGIGFLAASFALLWLDRLLARRAQNHPG